MKYFLLITLLFGTSQLKSQRYVLLDKHISQPVTYSNTITSADKFNELFPVEKKRLEEFVKALEEISEKLSNPGHLGEAKQYEIGCVKFTGVIVSTAKGERLDYVLNSNCDEVRISMHLSDAKISNASNAYFIKTWIKYIKDSMK